MIISYVLFFYKILKNFRTDGIFFPFKKWGEKYKKFQFFILQNVDLFLYGIREYFSLKIKYGKITKYILIIMSQFNRYAKKSKLDRAINTYIIKY